MTDLAPTIAAHTITKESVKALAVQTAKNDPEAPVYTGTVNITNKPDTIAQIKRVAELKKIEAAGAKAKKERESIEPHIWAALTREDGTIAEQAIVRGNPVLTLSSDRTADLWNHDALLAAWPDAYVAIYDVKPYRFFTISIATD